MTHDNEIIRVFLDSIQAKRARLIIQHLLAHGSITTEEIEQLYGYKHAPRAARDVREQGIPLETFSAKASDGRLIAAYRFGDLSKIEYRKRGGRKSLRELKKQLLESKGSFCNLCQKQFDSRLLQVDHAIPYEVLGDAMRSEDSLDSYQLVCRSCNRDKSWACEHCANWLDQKNPQICQTCFWVRPDHYSHIALQPQRRTIIYWSEEEVVLYDSLLKQAQQQALTLGDYLKKLIRHG